jgi:hypothetical protein
MTVVGWRVGAEVGLDVGAGVGDSDELTVTMMCDPRTPGAKSPEKLYWTTAQVRVSMHVMSFWYPLGATPAYKQACDVLTAAMVHNTRAGSVGGGMSSTSIHCMPSVSKATLSLYVADEPCPPATSISAPSRTAPIFARGFSVVFTMIQEAFGVSTESTHRSE